MRRRDLSWNCSGYLHWVNITLFIFFSGSKPCSWKQTTINLVYLIRECAVVWRSTRAGLETLLRLFCLFLFLVFILLFCRVEKKAIHGIINMNISEQSKTYNEEDLSILVVKMNLSTTNDFVQIAAPGVRLLPHIVNAKSPSWHHSLNY